jgi:hypothetical protein
MTRVGMVGPTTVDAEDDDHLITPEERYRVAMTRQ